VTQVQHSTKVTNHQAPTCLEIVDVILV